MKYCEKCGAQMEDDQNYCVSCGRKRKRGVIIAAKVIAIIGLVCAGICLLGSLVIGSVAGNELGSVAVRYFLEGIYGLIASAGSLSAISGKSKTKIIVWGVINIFWMGIGSILMFCIKEEDL